MYAPFMWLWLAALLVAAGALIAWAIQVAGAGRRNGSANDGPVRALLIGVLALAVVMLLTGFVWGIAGGGDRWARWDMWDHMARMHGGGRDTSGDPLTRGGVTETVVIRNFTFSPGNLRVPAGATVTWTNRDAAPHDAVSQDGSWRTEILYEGDSGSVTFGRPGEYRYYCSIHPSMEALLTVR
jgi:plastocyanin